MSVRWTWISENVSMQSFRETQATAMALDSTGDCVLLAGRRGLDVVRILDMPQCRPTRVKHKTIMKWDISVAEWNPHPQQKNQFVIASNQTADVFTLRNTDYVQEMTLKAHTRSISNLNWAVFDPTILATCSVDTYIYIWDTREPRKPASAFSTFAGAGQVRWNKKDTNCLATVHDGDIRLWDKRKGNQAVKYISAHLSKIYSLDWDPNHDSFLITASQDCSAKIWDTNSEQKALSEIRFDAPQWKARYTPFGDGIVTISMPQLRQREKNLLLWTQSNTSAPIHSFTGHTDDILEFQWRPKDASIDYHMVTWARDYSLRVWRVEPHLQRLCGVEVQDFNVSGLSDLEVLGSPPNFPSSVGLVASLPAGHSHQRLTETERVGGVGGQGRSVSDADGSAASLEQEFMLVAHMRAPRTLINTDLQSRSCLVSVSSDGHMASIRMAFPFQYPVKVVPKLSFTSTTTLDNHMQGKVLEILNHLCLQQVEMDSYCISPCVNQLITIIDEIQLNATGAMDGTSSKQSSTAGSPVATSYGSASDKNIPFPRTSGARFCSTDKLVMFTRPSNIKKSSATFQQTPKALSTLSQYRGQNTAQSPKNQEAISIARFYKDRENKHRRGGKHRRKNSDVTQISQAPSPSSGLVVLFDTSGLLPIHQKLAETYVLIPEDVPMMCSMNASAAAAVGRKDLVQVWSLAHLATSSDLKPSLQPDEERPWARHPFGRQLLKSLMDHYSSIHDVQTLAMLCCAFGERVKQLHPWLKDRATGPTVQNFYVQDESDPIFSPAWIRENFGMAQGLSESPDDYKFGYPVDPDEMDLEVHKADMQLLDPMQQCQYDKFKMKYADILYKWNLLDARAEILNYVAYPLAPRECGLEFFNFGMECTKCRNKSQTIQCLQCKKYAFECSICHVAVRGASTFCLTCGHGGHTQHILDWFQTESVCPTGCGCQCEGELTRSM